MRSSLQLAAGLCFCINLTLLTLLSWRLWFVEENHWAADHRLALIALIPQVPLAWLARHRLLQGAMVTSWAVVVGLTIISVHYNALLPYNLWIERGMPAKWTTNAPRGPKTVSTRVSSRGDWVDFESVQFAVE